MEEPLAGEGDDCAGAGGAGAADGETEDAGEGVGEDAQAQHPQRRDGQRQGRGIAQEGFEQQARGREERQEAGRSQKDEASADSAPAPTPGLGGARRVREVWPTLKVAAAMPSAAAS